MRELARDQVGDGDEVAHGAVAARLGLGGLDLCIRRLDTPIGQSGVEGVEDAVPMGFDGLGEVLHRLEAAAPGPAVPACEQRLGLLAGVGQAEDLAQALLDAVGTVGLEVEAAQIDVLSQLTAVPILLVLKPNVAAALEHGSGFHLCPTHRIDGLIGELDDVEFIEGDVRPRQLFLHPATIARRHIDADVADVLRAAAVGLEVVGELRDHLGLAPLGGEQQPRFLEIVKEADVLMPAPRGGLVQADGGDAGEVLLRARLLDVMVQHPPQAHVAHPQQLRDLAYRHRPAQGDDQRLHQLGEAAVGTRPRDLDLGGLAASAAAHPRDLGLNVGLELEEVQMTPFPRLGVMHRLVLRPAVRAGKVRPASKPDREIDPPRRRIEVHLPDLPRCLQPQRDGEQGCGIHGSDLRRLACGHVDASCGPARALRAVWTTPGPRRSMTCRPMTRSRRGPPVAHTLGPRAHMPTGPATSWTKCALKGANRQGQSQALTHRKRNRGLFLGHLTVGRQILDHLWWNPR